MPPALSTLSEALEKATHAINQHLQSPQGSIEAKWLMQHLTGYSSATLITKGHEPLTPDINNKLNSALEQRLKGVPLAYIMGIADFMGEDYAVSKAVLIPRSDTECLVHWVIETASQLSKETKKQPLRIAELGVGSGAPLSAVGMALAKTISHKAWVLHGTDLSSAALTIAEQNLNAKGVHAILFQGYWCAALPIEERYHILYSNPPYIAEGDSHLLGDGICAEPRLALIAQSTHADNSRGMGDLAHIIDNTPKHLFDDGYLALEHGYTQGAMCRQLMADRGYQHIRTHNDTGGHERVTVGQYKGDSAKPITTPSA